MFFYEVVLPVLLIILPLFVLLLILAVWEMVRIKKYIRKYY